MPIERRQPSQHCWAHKEGVERVESVQVPGTALGLENTPQGGQPGWLSGLVLSSAQGVIPETWDQVPRRAPCMEPVSPPACVSASLSPRVYHE